MLATHLGLGKLILTMAVASRLTKGKKYILLGKIASDQTSKNRGGSKWSTVGPRQEISVEGVVYDQGSIYGRLQTLTDLRKARGKRYSLPTVLMIVLLAKLSGANSSTEIAEWGVYHQPVVEALLRIKPKRMPERSTYRRILVYKSLFAPDYPKPGFGKIQTDFLMAQKVNKGHGRIEKRTLTTSEMLNAYATWPGLAQVYRLERKFQWRRRGRCYKTSYEVKLGITSLSRKNASPKRLLEIRRAHWGIETGSHYRRDVTLKEDATRFTIGQGARVLANIHNLVLALIRQTGFLNATQARRFFAAHPTRAFSLLVPPFS